MKRNVSLLAALTALLVVLAAQQSLADDRSQVKVKGTKTVNGVIVVDVLKSSKAVTLQCNEGQPACNSLKAGDYWLVELPENHGMYDCKNVEVYPGDKDPGGEDDRDEAQRLGAYCLVEK
jgi:uncharacterized protein (DUF2141 family)